MGGFNYHLRQIVSIILLELCLSSSYMSLIGVSAPSVIWILPQPGRNYQLPDLYHCEWVSIYLYCTWNGRSDTVIICENLAQTGLCGSRSCHIPSQLALGPQPSCHLYHRPHVHVRALHDDLFYETIGRRLSWYVLFSCYYHSSNVTLPQRSYLCNSGLSWVSVYVSWCSKFIPGTWKCCPCEFRSLYSRFFWPIWYAGGLGYF